MSRTLAVQTCRLLGVKHQACPIDVRLTNYDQKVVSEDREVERLVQPGYHNFLLKSELGVFKTWILKKIVHIRALKTPTR